MPQQELFVTVRVEASRHFRRDGADVHSDVTVSFAQAALGGKIRIPGIYDSLLVTVSLLEIQMFKFAAFLFEGTYQHSFYWF